jgi:hypothetical protein
MSHLDSRWIIARAREFTAFVIDEHLNDLDRIQHLMQEHYGEPFTREDAATMWLAMADEVDG